MTKALREMQGKYVGNRPIKVRTDVQFDTDDSRYLLFFHLARYSTLLDTCFTDN